MPTWGPRGGALIAIALSTGILIVYMPGFVALAGPVAIGVLLLLLASRAASSGKEPIVRYRLAVWTLGAFVLHLCLSLGIWFTGAWRITGPDAQTYHLGALEIIGHWNANLPFQALPSGKEGFFYLLAALYQVLGPYAHAGLVANAIMAAALVPVLTYLTDRLFGSFAASYTPPLLVFLPGLLLWTSQLLREAGVLLLIAVAVTCACRLAERITIAPLIFLTGAVAILFTFRGNVGLLVAGGLAIGLVIGKRDVVSGFSSALGILSIILLLILGLGLGYSGYKIAVQADLDQVDVIRQELSTTAESGFAPDADVSSTSRALAYLPIGFTSFVFGPFPWELQNFRQLVTFPDVVVWWCLLPSLWRGLRAGRRLVGRQVFVLVTPALMTGLMLSLLIGNYGTAVRERPQLIVLLVPFIALGLSLRHQPSDGDNSADTPGLQLSPVSLGN